MTEFRIDSPTETDIEQIPGWVSATRELSLISDESSNVLHPETFQRWLRDSVTVAVVHAGDQPVALATLSLQEVALPEGTVELCHLIVHPRWRRRYHGSRLVFELTDRAKEFGFKRLVGRVVPRNAVAHALLSYLHWSSISSVETWMKASFVWYEKSLRS